jgi:hypothetical protein
LIEIDTDYVLLHLFALCFASSLPFVSGSGQYSSIKIELFSYYIGIIPDYFGLIHICYWYNFFSLDFYMSNWYKFIEILKKNNLLQKTGNDLFSLPVYISIILDKQQLVY